MCLKAKFKNNVVQDPCAFFDAHLFACWTAKKATGRRVSGWNTIRSGVVNSKYSACYSWEMQGFVQSILLFAMWHKELNLSIEFWYSIPISFDTLSLYIYMFPPPKIRGSLVFKIWTKRGVMKKLLRNRELFKREGILLERGGNFEIILSVFKSQLLERSDCTIYIIIFIIMNL